MAGKDVKMQSMAGMNEERILSSDVFESEGRNLPPANGSGTITEEARDIDIYHQCDVVVVGGGPAGCAAAWAAAKAGADVTLVDRDRAVTSGEAPTAKTKRQRHGQRLRGTRSEAVEQWTAQPP